MHNLLMQFFTPDSSKMEVFETYFFDIVTTQNDHPRYVKHVLGRIYVFFALFGYQVGGGGGGGLPRDGCTTCLCSVPAHSLSHYCWKQSFRVFGTGRERP